MNQPGIECARVALDGIRAMSGLETSVRQSGLEPLLLELVKLRAPQMNPCAYCIGMHIKDARAGGRVGSTCTPSAPGARPRSSPTGSGPRREWAETVRSISHG